MADLFDAYADQFETHLTENLRYDVPRLLRAAVGEAAGAEEKSWAVLDMGCGTGLCGALFRDLAGRLIGADISPRMIEKARERGERGNLDLALSADVFVYAGALGDVFAGCAAALRAGGLFAFSIESLEGEGFTLLPTGRFAHSRAYIEALAAESGFAVSRCDAIGVRRDKTGSHIPGHLYVLRRLGKAPGGENY